MMTREQEDAIRKLVDEGGWDAVRNHPTLGPLWAEEERKAKAYTDEVIDR